MLHISSIRFLSWIFYSLVQTFLFHSYLALNHDLLSIPNLDEARIFPQLVTGLLASWGDLEAYAPFHLLLSRCFPKPLPLSAAICFQPYPTGRKHEHFHCRTGSETEPWCTWLTTGPAPEQNQTKLTDGNVNVAGSQHHIATRDLCSKISFSTRCINPCMETESGSVFSMKEPLHTVINAVSEQTPLAAAPEQMLRRAYSSTPSVACKSWKTRTAHHQEGGKKGAVRQWERGGLCSMAQWRTFYREAQRHIQWAKSGMLRQGWWPDPADLFRTEPPFTARVTRGQQAFPSCRLEKVYALIT